MKEFPGDKPTGKTRRFLMTVTKTVEVALDESVIAQGVADEGYIMTNPTESQVLEHLAFNLVGNKIMLSQINGYANCPDTSAIVDHKTWDDEIEVEELASKAGLPETAGSKRRKAPCKK